MLIITTFVKSVTIIIHNYYHYYYRFKPCQGLAAFLLLAGVKPADVFAIQRYESPFMSDTFLNFINNTRTFGVGFTPALTPNLFFLNPLCQRNVHCHLSLFLRVVVCILLL